MKIWKDKDLPGAGGGGKSRFPLGTGGGVSSFTPKTCV